MGDNVTNLSDHKGTGLLKYTPELAEEIQKAAKQIVDLKGKNKANNTKKQELRTALEAKGISKKAFDFAMKLYEMDSNERKAIEFALAACIEALGVKPATVDMFKDGVDPKTGLPFTTEAADAAES